MNKVNENITYVFIPKKTKNNEIVSKLKKKSN